MYLFDAAGKYDPKQVVKFDDVDSMMKAHFTRIREAIQAKREVIIEDGDGYAVFHAHLGAIIFPVMDLEGRVKT